MARRSRARCEASNEGDVTADARRAIQELLGRLADGDRSAIEPAFDMLWPVLRRFAACALEDDGHGEDAAQQAIVKLFAQVAEFDPARDGLAWAFAITSYEIRTIRRRAQRRRETSLDHADPVPATTDTPEARLIACDLIHAARTTLSGMTEADVQVILAALDDHRPAGDATFRKRLQRAVGRLRQLWRTKHDLS